MANIDPVVNNAFLDQQVVSWSGLDNTNTSGNPFNNSSGYDASCIQVEGSFGTGGSLAIEGSLDGANWHTLLNAEAGAVLNITAAGLYVPWEPVLYLRPRVTAGTGVSLNVTLVKNRAHPR